LDDERAKAEALGHWPLTKALTHPRILAPAVISFAITYGRCAVGFFLPTIVAGFLRRVRVRLSVTDPAGDSKAAMWVVGALSLGGGPVADQTCATTKIRRNGNSVVPSARGG
jgi:hypothetical protein